MTTVKKTIFLAIPSLQPGGMERVMSELASYLCTKIDFDVHLLLYGIKRDVFFDLPENINIHKPSFIFNNNVRTWSTFRTIFWIRRKIKLFNPDVILSFGEYWNNFILLSTLGLNHPVFVSDRCQPDKSLGGIHDQLRNCLYPKAAGVICQTKTAKIIYSKMFKHNNFQVIGNPIREIFSDPEKDVPKENIVLSVGRLIKTKHHDDLIKIFAEINPDNWKLIIVGDDALKQKNKERLEKLVNDLKMKDKIELVGKRYDVDDHYKRAKIFAFTSSSEGFPNVIGEAMSAGLPVIAYDCVAGPSDLIQQNKTGFLIKLHDKIGFKQGLVKLIEDENLRFNFGKEAKIKIQDFSVLNIGLKFEKTILNAHTPN